MQLKDTYYYFQSVIPPHICDRIIKEGLSKQILSGVTGNKGIKNMSEEDKFNLQKLRNSNVSWLNGEWIYQWIRPCVIEANKKTGWFYDIQNTENFQFTIYNENQFYDWHADYFCTDEETAKAGKPENFVRKISVTVSLSDPKDYEGGELEFIVDDVPKHRHSIICNEIAPRGSIVVFPSFVHHRVNPVTRGTRYSLVVWHQGPKWK